MRKTIAAGRHRVYSLVSIYVQAMSRSFPPTRERIIRAASKLFYSEGLRAVSVDAVAEKAGVTKRTLYYHFRSKDDLVAAYLETRDEPSLALFRRWFAEAGGGVADKVAGIFRNLADTVRHPRWKGCGFLRTSVELFNLPGHPAMKAGRAHKKHVEDWLCAVFDDAEIGEARQLARQVILLMDGAFAVVLLHRDPSYMDAAGDAAARLIHERLVHQRLAPAAACETGGD
jgi:AcrR family transcriptional regulator